MPVPLGSTLGAEIGGTAGLLDGAGIAGGGTAPPTPPAAVPPVPVGGVRAGGDRSGGFGAPVPPGGVGSTGDAVVSGGPAGRAGSPGSAGGATGVPAPGGGTVGAAAPGGVTGGAGGIARPAVGTTWLGPTGTPRSGAEIAGSDPGRSSGGAATTTRLSSPTSGPPVEPVRLASRGVAARLSNPAGGGGRIGADGANSLVFAPTGGANWVVEGTDACLISLPLCGTTSMDGVLITGGVGGSIWAGAGGVGAAGATLTFSFDSALAVSAGGALFAGARNRIAPAPATRLNTAAPTVSCLRVNRCTSFATAPAVGAAATGGTPTAAAATVAAATTAADGALGAGALVGFGASTFGTSTFGTSIFGASTLGAAGFGGSTLGAGAGAVGAALVAIGTGAAGVAVSASTSGPTPGGSAAVRENAGLPGTSTAMGSVIRDPFNVGDCGFAV